jgi:L-alanine-DL-glutamate epimerase-like enolase superfamily enzyme
MQITQVNVDLLRVPLLRTRGLPRTDDAEAGVPVPDAVTVLLVQLATDSEPTGLGFGHTAVAGRSLRAAIEDDLASLVIGANPVEHERIHQRLPFDSPAVARAAVDLAVWDLKGKAANLPLWRLLGGARDSAPVYAAETAWPWMSGEQILSAYEPLQARGMKGLRVAVGTRDPESDARRLQSVREHVGLDDWFGVTANHAYDAATALAMGRFLEEELDADWFEDPVADGDAAGLTRLADKLELPVAAGGSFTRASDFARWTADTAAGVLRPDVMRLGGLTPALKVIALAESFARPVVPVLLPEVGVHLACGLPGVRAVDYVGWLEPLWKEPPPIRDGLMAPPTGAGLGLTLNPEAVAKLRLA